MKQQLARYTSAVLNPIILSLAFVVLLSFQSTSSTSDGLKWSLLLVGVTVLPVSLVIIYLVHKDKLEGIFIKVRQQRNQIYLLASLCTVACCAILFSLRAPLVLFATTVSALSATLVFMLINLPGKSACTPPLPPAPSPFLSCCTAPPAHFPQYWCRP